MFKEFFNKLFGKKVAPVSESIVSESTKQEEQPTSSVSIAIEEKKELPTEKIIVPVKPKRAKAPPANKKASPANKKSVAKITAAPKNSAVSTQQKVKKPRVPKIKKQ